MPSAARLLISREPKHSDEGDESVPLGIESSLPVGECSGMSPNDYWAWAPRGTRRLTIAATTVTR